MNHVSHIDWMYLWSVIDRQGDLSFWKVVTKILPVRSIPILGQCTEQAGLGWVGLGWAGLGWAGLGRAKRAWEGEGLE